MARAYSGQEMWKQAELAWTEKPCVAAAITPNIRMGLLKRPRLGSIRNARSGASFGTKLRNPLMPLWRTGTECPVGPPAGSGNPACGADRRERVGSHGSTTVGDCRQGSGRGSASAFHCRILLCRLSAEVGAQGHGDFILRDRLSAAASGPGDDEAPIPEHLHVELGHHLFAVCAICTLVYVFVLALFSTDQSAYRLAGTGFLASSFFFAASQACRLSARACGFRLSGSPT